METPTVCDGRPLGAAKLNNTRGTSRVNGFRACADLAEKHYNNDPAKSKARELVRSVIERNLLKFRNPKDLRVLCFPGIDAQEILEVYDQLKIPRGNILGLEREGNIFKELQKRNLGIQLYHGTLDDYVRGMSMHDFDIISLDYTGNISNTQFENIRDICTKQRRNFFVLHCANLIRRENHDANIQYFVGQSFNEEFNKSSDNTSLYDRLYPGKDLIPRMEKERMLIQKINNRDSIKDEKSRAYSTIIRAAFLGASRAAYEKMFKFATGSDYLSLLKVLEERLKQDYGIGTLDVEHPFSGIPLRSSIITFLEMFNWTAIEYDLGKYGLPSPQGLFSITMALYNTAKGRKNFTGLDSEYYSYISESGSPMIGDIHFLAHSYKEQKCAEEISRLMGYPYQINVIDPLKLERCVIEYVKIQSKFFSIEKRNEQIRKITKRTFLGNSSRPVLSKKRYLEELGQNASDEAIKQKYRGWENKPLAQWKAHHTMGTYDGPVEPADSETAEGNESSGLSKEDAIMMLEEGIPIDEIVDAFPNSFTRGQLRAMKAHITMGTYAK
jgi:hypothetical protein